MPKPVVSRVTNPNQCVDCGDGVGEQAKVLPVTIAEDNGEGGGRRERYCPQCFVYRRGANDARWYSGIRIGQILPLLCGACGFTTVAFGRRACARCGSRSIVLLTPKGVVLKASSLRAS